MSNFETHPIGTADEIDRLTEQAAIDKDFIEQYQAQVAKLEAALEESCICSDFVYINGNRCPACKALEKAK